MEISENFKAKLKKSPFFPLYAYIMGSVFGWFLRGKPIPPVPRYKTYIVRKYGRKFSLSTFIETGTYRGDMIDRTKDMFQTIYSIELDKSLYDAAKERFSNYPYISILNGDSGNVLPKLLESLNSPALFWLDAHLMVGQRGEQLSPICQELDTIFSHPLHGQHVILIDDARLFRGMGGYPQLNTLKRVIEQNHKNYLFEVSDDIIRIVPNMVASRDE